MLTNPPELIRILGPELATLLISCSFPSCWTNTISPLNPRRINPVNVQHWLNNDHLSAGNMGAEKGFFWRGLVEVHWDNCKCAFIAKNLNQSGTKVEVTVTFVSGGCNGGGGNQTES